MSVSSGTPRTQDEDSGLHDIRSLAQSTKQRLSKKITAAPPPDEDVLASSSAGWKNVALPEPAKMISLPALEQLPSKKQIKDQIKAAKVAPALAKPASIDESAPVVKAAPAASMSFGASVAKQQSKSKAPLYAIVGLGLAAAAGGLIYVATKGGDKPAPVVAKADTAPAPAAQPPPPPAAPPVVAAITTPPADTAAAAGSAAPVETAPPVVDTPVVAPPSKHVTKKGGDSSKKIDTKPEAAKPEAKKPTTDAVASKTGKASPKEGEPDFNDLLKEAGVKDPQKAKPALEKKSLSGSDFKSGMSGIASKAQACYAGTQGTAIVKLTVGPDGHVTKASVSGPFAGSAVAACVEAAVRGATFPAWEGGPQSFGYSFLLSE